MMPSGVPRVVAFADGGEQYHGADADADAQHREQAAQALGDDGGEREADQVTGEHVSSLHR